jgi:hypothetical protein
VDCWGGMLGECQLLFQPLAFGKASMSGLDGAHPLPHGGSTSSDRALPGRGLRSLISVRTATKICGWQLPQPIRAASARRIRASLLRQILARSEPGIESRFTLQTRPQNLETSPPGCGCRDSKPLILGLAFAPALGGLWYKTGLEPPNQRAPRLKPTPTTGSS